MERKRFIYGKTDERAWAQILPVEGVGALFRDYSEGIENFKPVKVALIGLTSTGDIEYLIADTEGKFNVAREMEGFERFGAGDNDGRFDGKFIIPRVPRR